MTSFTAKKPINRSAGLTAMRGKLPLLFILLSLTFVAPPSSLGAMEPVEQLRPLVENIIDVLSEANQHTHSEIETADKIMGIVQKGFDFKEMSKRVLGRRWRTLTPEKQKLFVEQFTQLLRHAYVMQMKNYSNQKVEFTRQRKKGNRAEVKTLVIDGGINIPVSYIMHLQNERWLVYDIVVEGVSLVRNYKEQFQEILRKEDFEVLSQKINSKLEELQPSDRAT